MDVKVGIAHRSENPYDILQEHSLSGIDTIIGTHRHTPHYVEVS